MNNASMPVPLVTGNENEKLTIRKATKADLDDITRLTQASFTDDPGWNYRFPYRQRFPKDNWEWTRRDYEECLTQPEKYVVLVVTASRQTNGEKQSKPIALAVWDVSVLTEPIGRGSGIGERLDASPTRSEEHERTLDRAYAQYFGGYGARQIHLWLLTTHPDFRRRGAGTMLCNWGSDRAKEEGWVLTVMASPMGKPLYQRLGYELLGSVTVQVEEEVEKLTVYCLVNENIEGD